MRIVIAARKSDLARLQARLVGAALREKNKDLEIEYLFSTSLGDQNQSDPLWQMPEKGVFTEDLTKKLLSRECDMVVHSWKDLPTVVRAETEIAATLPRADARDLILFRKNSLAEVKKNKILNIFSSSPRRILSVGEFLSWALPFKAEIKFHNVRGNILTRVKKLMNGEADALVIAKAALDRIFESQTDEFRAGKIELKNALADCLWMVVPLSENPGAPAQGALAIEILNERSDIKALLTQINCTKTYKSVVREREVLASYGGGCHQKIGVTCLVQAYGEIEYQRGLTDAGLRLDSISFKSAQALSRVRVSEEAMFPITMRESSFYERKNIAVDLNSFKNKNLFIARSEALPEAYNPAPSQVIWTSGSNSWRKLAARGIWVSGSQDGLGEEEGFQVDNLITADSHFVKLTHSEAADLSRSPVIATYDLVDKIECPDLSQKTHFYWLSFSNFKRALRRYPSLRFGWHACGPGHTYELIRKELGAAANIEIFLSQSSWVKAYRKESEGSAT